MAHAFDVDLVLARTRLLPTWPTPRRKYAQSPSALEAAGDSGP
jgi:hypothetical protein